MKKRDLIIRILIFVKIICLLLSMLSWGLLYNYDLSYTYEYPSVDVARESVAEKCRSANKFITNFMEIELIWAVIFFVLMCFKNKSKKTESTSKIKGEEIKSLQ